MYSTDVPVICLPDWLHLREVTPLFSDIWRIIDRYTTLFRLFRYLRL